MTLARGLFALPVLAGLTVWVVASGGPRSSAPPPPAPRAAAHVTVERTPLPATARLRASLATMSARPPVARNPFRFETPARVTHAAAGDRDPEPLEPIATAPPRPDLKLVGIAEDGEGDARQRTAIVSGMNQLYLVKEGEQIALRFLVKRIGGDAIELEDLTDSSTVRLVLR